MVRKMKDSGVEWIGEIPEDWDRTSLLNLLRTNISDGPHETPVVHEEGIPFISVDSLNETDKIDFSVCKKYISEEDYGIYYKKAKLQEGDILFSKAATIGKTAIVGKEKFMVWSPLAIIKTNSDIAYNKYIYYVLNSDKLIKYVSLLGGYNTQINVGMRNLEKAYIPFPGKLYQKIIADYLDNIIPVIDNIIHSIKISIEDYKKYKQSILADKITRGLRKQKLKQTKNIHIPEIPDAWEMKKLKYVFYIKKDIAGKIGYDVLSITQKGIKVKDITSNAGQLAADYSNYQRVNVGDFAMNHMDLLTGWVDVSEYNGVTSPDYRVFNFISEKGYSRRYYLYLMQMCYMNRIFYGLGQGVSNFGRWRLQAEKFLNFTIPVPPIEEQEEIAQYLDVKCGEIDKIITEKQALVSELENYKKSLIYEYVTGKKEVPVENMR